MEIKLTSKLASKILIAGVITALILTLTSCNRNVIDTTYKFDKAIIFLPDGGKIEGEVENWVDYEQSDMVQVKIDGKTYLTHSSNVIFISE